jgi:hypothetical protein
MGIPDNRLTEGADTIAHRLDPGHRGAAGREKAQHEPEGDRLDGFGQLGRRHDRLGMAARRDGLPDSKFDEPIPLPRGGPLVTLQRCGLTRLNGPIEYRILRPEMRTYQCAIQIPDYRRQSAFRAALLRPCRFGLRQGSGFGSPGPAGYWLRLGDRFTCLNLKCTRWFG